MLERDLIKKIKQHIASRYGVICFKHHGGVYSEIGVPDLIGVIPPCGRMLALEVKTPTGRTTPSQINWLKRYREAGALTGVVRSVDDVDELLTYPH